MHARASGRSSTAVTWVSQISAGSSPEPARGRARDDVESSGEASSGINISTCIISASTDTVMKSVAERD